MKNNIEKYQEILCTMCSNKNNCTKDKIIITSFNNTKNIRCLNYEFKDIQK